MEVVFLAIEVLLMPEALVNVSDNYNRSKVSNAALVKFDYMLESLWIKSLSIRNYYGIIRP